jgi:hypothetical protein
MAANKNSVHQEAPVQNPEFIDAIYYEARDLCRTLSISRRLLKALEDYAQLPKRTPLADEVTIVVEKDIERTVKEFTERYKQFTFLP